MRTVKINLNVKNYGRFGVFEPSLSPYFRGYEIAQALMRPISSLPLLFSSYFASTYAAVAFCFLSVSSEEIRYFPANGYANT